jgi:hypothetical protein
MLSRIVMGILASILFVAICFSLFQIGKSVQKIMSPGEKIIAGQKSTTTDIFIAGEQEEKKSEAVEELAIQTDAVTATATTRSVAISSAPKNVIVPIVFDRGEMLYPVRAGKISAAWNNNSWGIELEKGKQLATVHFLNPWAAFSVFTKELSLSGTRSIALVFHNESPDMINHLYLSFYRDTTKVGGTDISRYAKKTGDELVVQIPYEDIELTSATITDIVIESDQMGDMGLVSIGMSSEQVASIPKPIVVETPIPVSPPPAAPETPKAEVIPIATTEPVIYFAGLKNGWQYKTRKAKVEINNDERSTTGAAAKVFYETAGTGSFSLFRAGGVDTTGLKSLRIRVYGGITDHEWQQLYVTLYDRGGNKLGTKDISAYSANGGIKMQVWNDYTLPLSAFGAEGKIIGTIDIENVNATQVGDSLWIDYVLFQDSL